MELIPESGWCISEWAICDFQWGGGWKSGRESRFFPIPPSCDAFVRAGAYRRIYHLHLVVVTEN